MRLTFPFRFISNNYFGQVWRPYATLLVRKKDQPKIWIERVMIIDSGADFTIFPKKDAFIFGIDLTNETRIDKTHGIGGAEKIFLYKNLEIKVDSTLLKIPVGFLNRNDIPALMGRQNFLEIFRLIFENHKTLIEN